MLNYSTRLPLLFNPRIVVFLISLFSISLVSGQSPSQETAYFQDVTATHMPLDEATHALDMVLVDVNSDGLLDIALALEKEPNRLYINDGEGKFIWEKSVFASANHDSEHVRAGDFNNDGYVDLIFVAEDDQNHEYYVGNGDGSFNDESKRLPGKSEGNALEVGDINGDGLLDIVIGNTGDSPANFVWLNNPEDPGSFLVSNAGQLSTDLDLTQSIKMVDVDQDGDLDIVVGNERAPARLYFNDGSANFAEIEDNLPQGVPMHTREVVAFDANADGLVDLFFANLTSNGGEKEYDPTGRLFINIGDGKFEDQTAKRIPSYDFSTYAVNVIDYDQDGDEDLILSAVKIPPFDPMPVQVLQNDGQGNFTLKNKEVIPEEFLARSWGIAIADLNGDQVPDLVIGAWGGQVRLIFGKKQ